MDILSKYRKILTNGLKKDYPDNNFKNISFEFPRDRSHGDFSTNAAMVLSKRYNLDLEIIFNNVVKIFSETHDFTNIEIAKSGFINFFIKDSILYELLSSIIKEEEKFGKTNIGRNQKVNVEYVSANPTGPLHVGHTRGAVFGDTLSNLLSFVGYDVCREYYINDSGEQITKLAKSVYIRYLQSLGETKEEIQEGFYPGEYLIELGEKLKNKFGSKFKDSSEDVWLELFKKESINFVMNLIKEDLNSLNIKHNVFTSEKKLLNDNKVDKTFNLLNEKNLLYEGITSPPKGSNKDEWSEVKHTLFKSKEFGDDEDRVVKKHNGEWTYFMPDIAYHLDKYERGYKKIINIFGADHSGYINRMKSAVKAISDSKADFEIKTCQLVRLSRSGKPIKMSKRSGSFITLSEIVDEVGSDAVRFMMVSRKNDAQLDFDFEVFKNENNDNPIFYIQYAHARISSLINNASEKLNIKEIDESISDLNLLKNINERNIIMLLANYPKIIEQSALFMEPHRISFYLRDLSSAFHQYWNLKVNNKRLIILDKDNIDLSLSRITLLKCVAITIRSGLAILGIRALKEL
ncbi:MAG: arginine--tRNA ligase [Pseudomonadota bacterium]|nr:arginine--tRNA ligase [Pseudomonadota bacterium]MEC9459480.1 arginine--tRNA ligase [Pseudomonadota bacterium]